MRLTNDLDVKTIAVGAILAIAVRLGLFLLGAVLIYGAAAQIGGDAYGRLAAGLILLYALRK